MTATNIEIWEDAPETFDSPSSMVGAILGPEDKIQAPISMLGNFVMEENEEAARRSQGWKLSNVGDQWGAKRKWTYFRAEVTIPTNWDFDNIWLSFSHEEKYLDSPNDDNFPAGPEGQVFINKERVAAIDIFHKDIHFKKFRRGRNSISAVFFAGRCNVLHKLSKLEAVWRDANTYELYSNLKIAFEIAKELPDISRVKYKYLEAL